MSSSHGGALDFRISTDGISDAAYGISGANVPEIPCRGIKYIRKQVCHVRSSLSVDGSHVSVS